MERTNILRIYYLLLSLVIQSLSVLSDDSARLEDHECQPPWEKVHRSCVLFVKNDHRSWQDSYNNCKSMTADLLCISDQEELTKLKVTLGKHSTTPRLAEWWIGLQRTMNKDFLWRWTDDGSPMSKFLTWTEPRPYNSSYRNNPPRDCAILNRFSFLKAWTCEEKKPYICEQVIMTENTTSSTTSSTFAPPSISSEITVQAASSLPELRETSPLFHSTGIVSSSALVTNSNNTFPYDNSSTTLQTNTSYSRSFSISTLGMSKSVNTAEKEMQIYYNHEGITTEASIGTTVLTDSTRKAKATKDEFEGCFSINYANACPPVEAFGIYWPRTEAGEMARVSCNKGQAQWKCNRNPTCWYEEPDVKQCTSENILKLTQTMEKFTKDLDSSDKVVPFTESLVATIADDNPLSEQDLFQSTKLMLSVSTVKPQNSSDAKKIMQNVVKFGSSLVSKERSSTWSLMNIESQRTIASSLLISMESVVVQMLNEYTAPTIETINEENLVVQLNVVDVSAVTSSTEEIAYQGGSNFISLPPENVKEFSTGGLAHIVFMNYHNMQDFLTPEEENVDSNMARTVVSGVFGVSIGDKKDPVKLLQPVTITLKTNKGDNIDWQLLCSFWNFSLRYSGAWSQDGCSLVSYNDTHTTCQCNHLTNFAVLMDIHKTKMAETDATTLSCITYVGIITSIICLFLSWITFICLRSIQGERNSIHTHLVFCLFIAEVVFLAGIERTENKMACAIIAGCLHYFFLSAFTWMFIEGVHILFMLVQVFDAAKSRLKYYYFIGYVCPLITVAISAAVFHQGFGTDKYCWLTTERMFIWSFAGPVGLILLVNLLVLIYAMSAVCTHSDYVFATEKSKSENIRAWIQGALAIEVLLGLTWVFGYFYISEDAIVMAYLFTIFNSLQGVFIFVCHCILNKKVWKEYRRFISYKKMSFSSATNSSSKYGSGIGANTDSSFNMAGCRKQSDRCIVKKLDRRQSIKSTTVVA